MSATEYDLERPWARQPWDSDLGWALFQDYLALDQPRTLNRLRAPVSWARLEAMAAECYWSARARFWDEHLSEIRTATFERVTEESAEQVAKRQLTLCRDLQELSRLEIGALVKVAKTAQGFPGAVTPREAIRAGMVGIRLERLIMGEALDRVEVGPDLSALSAEDLRTVRALQAKAGVR